MKKKGFTLIELLAVIVILAIIALIATPIVLNIISDSKRSAKLISAENYLSAAEKAIALSTLNNKTVEGGVYVIGKDGNICLENPTLTGCAGEVLALEISGEKPDRGYVTIAKGEITEIDLYYNGELIKKTGDDEFIYPEYEVGEEIIFNPGDGDRTWNVINETKDTLILMLNENIIQFMGWNHPDLYHESNKNDGTICNNTSHGYTLCTDEGPEFIFYVLNGIESVGNQINISVEWINVDPIKDYEFINNTSDSYKGLEIKNGVTTIFDDKGNKNIIGGTTIARLLTVEEIYKILITENPYIAQYYSNKTFDDNFDLVQEHFQLTNEVMSTNNIKSWKDALNKFIYGEDVNINKLKFNDNTVYNNILLTYESKIEGINPEEEITIPQWLLNNLEDEVGKRGYLLLNSISNLFSANIDFDYKFYLNNVVSEGSGIRPVIEIKKSKLK